MADTSTPTAGGTAAQNDALAQLEVLLAGYGLASLGQWAWQQVLQNRSASEIAVAIQQTPQFQARFPAIALRREKGLAPLSPADYIAYEQQAGQALRAAGLPPGFYDQHQDFTNLLANDVSISELNSRITNGYQQVAQAPQEVRRAFAQYFGVDGDAALAALFLDPSKAVPVLENHVRAAQFGGAAAERGFQIDAAHANKFALRGFSDGQVQQGMDQLAQLKPLFDETATESMDFTAQDQGVESVFSGAKDLQRRLDERKAATSGVGGAASDSLGTIGLGVAK